MRRMKVLLLVLMLFAAVSPAMAVFEDDFQNHPLNDLNDTWTINGSALPDIVNFPTEYSQAKSLRMQGTAPNPATVINKNPYHTNYFSFVYRPGSAFSDTAKIEIYNSTMGLITSLPWSTLTNATGLFEFVLTGGTLYVYSNGSLKNSSAYSGTDISYVKFIAPFNIASTYYFDDINTYAMIGANTNFTELSTDIQTTHTTYARYAYPASVYQQRVRNVASGTTLNTTTFTDKYGFIVYNTSNIFGYNYGPYEITTLKDGAIEARKYINYANSLNLGSIYWDQDSYVIGDHPQVSYNIVDPDFATYVYSVRIVKASDFSIVASQVLAYGTSYLVFDTSSWTPATYYAVLQRSSAGSAAEYLAWDFAVFETGFSVHGITYDLETGAILGNVSVNVSQGSNWYNTTSNGTTGAYNLSGMVTGVNTLINASKSGYTHENFSYIPETGGNYTLDLYLLSGTPVYAGNAILGQVYSYPWHQKIQGATVNIWNGSSTNSTTTTATGYYVFDNLAVAAYTMNATKAGYTNATDIAVNPGTPTRKDWLLHPIYTLTIRAQDSSTLAYISTFQAVINGTMYNTTTGTIAVTLDYGTYSVQVAVSGYSASTQTILLDSDKTLTVQVTGITTTTITDVDFISTQVYEKFIVRGLFDNPYSGLTLNVYNGSATTASFTGTTDSMGQVVFKLVKDRHYRGELSGSGISNMTFYFYGKEESYLITILTGFPTGGDRYTDILTNLTAVTVNATHSNLTIIYNDTRNTTSLVNFYATNLTTNVSCYKSSALNVTQLNCSVLAKGTYQFGFNATSSVYGFFQEDKVINFGAGNTSAALVPTKPPAATTGASQTIMTWGSIMLIVLTASLFSIKSVKLGAVIVPAESLMLWAFGWFPVDWKFLALAMVIGVLVYSRLSESKVAYQ